MPHPQIERTRKHRKLRRDLLNQLKDKPCADCGVRYHPWVMDFDHRDPAAKSFVLSTASAHRRVAAIVEEAAKCDVVCANCHRMRTYRQRYQRETL